MADQHHDGPPSLTVQALWLTAARIVGFGCSFFIPIVLSRLLDQHQFGLYRQAFLIIGTAHSILPLSVGNGAFYFFPRLGPRRGSAVLNILLFNGAVGLVGLLLLWLRPDIVVWIVGTSDVEPFGRMIGLTICLWVFADFLEIVATADQDVKASSIFIVLAQFTKSLFLFGAILWDPSIRALLYAAALQGVVQTGVLLWYVSRRFPGFYKQWDGPLFRSQLSYSIPLGLVGIGYILLLDLHKFMVSRSFDSAQFAIYSVGCTQLPLVLFLRHSVGAVMTRHLSLLQQQGEIERMKAVVLAAVRKLAIFYWPIAMFFLVVGREFLVLMFTARYAESWPIFAVALVLLPASIIVADPVLRAHAEYRHALLALRAVSVLGVYFAVRFGIERFGMIGAVSAMVAVVLAERAVLAWGSARILGMRRADLAPLVDLVKLGGAVVAAGGVTWLLRFLLLGRQAWLILALCGLTYGLAYGVLLWRTGVLTPEEREWIVGGLRGTARRIRL